MGNLSAIVSSIAPTSEQHCFESRCSLVDTVIGCMHRRIVLIALAHGLHTDRQASLSWITAANVVILSVHQFAE